jgi:hypothetical protein
MDENNSIVNPSKKNNRLAIASFVLSIGFLLLQISIVPFLGVIFWLIPLIPAIPNLKQGRKMW